MLKTAALLVSRQPLRPCGTTPWVAQTATAIAWLKERGLTLCTSTGMQTWELITALGSASRIPLRIYLQCREDEFCGRRTSLVGEFNLSPELVDWFRVQKSSAISKEKELLARDERIVCDAQVLIPIAVRPGGHMHRLIERGRAVGKEIVTDFQVSAIEKVPRLAYQLDEAALNPEIDSIGDRYLIHWTRAANSAWPGERLIDYYSDVIAASQYPRTGLTTLQRILRMKRIIASPRHMPDKTPTVAFSRLMPRQVVPLMKWRARYAEMSFEPYGVGILKEVAVAVGLRPVQYFSGRQDSGLSADDRWLSQSTGQSTDWRQEQEYRHLSDLSLDAVPGDALIAFTRFPEEAEVLCREFGIKAISLTK